MMMEVSTTFFVESCACAQVRVRSAFLCILAGKRRLILSALEQAQEALHGSVHPGGVQVARV